MNIHICEIYIYIYPKGVVSQNEWLVIVFNPIKLTNFDIPIILKPILNMEFPDYI